MADNIVFKEGFVKNDVSGKLSECISMMSASYTQNYENFQTSSLIISGSYESQINNIYEVMGNNIENEIKQVISELKSLGTDINEYYMKMINSSANTVLSTSFSIEKSAVPLISTVIHMLKYETMRLSYEERNECKGLAVIKRPDDPNRKPLKGSGLMTDKDWEGYEYLKPSFRCTGNDNGAFIECGSCKGQPSECTCDGGLDKISKNTVKALDQLVVIAEENNWDVAVTSGYRCETRLPEVGSNLGSKHHAGLAFDVVIKDSDGNFISPNTVYEVVTSQVDDCDYSPYSSEDDAYTYNGGSFVHVQIKEDGSIGIEED